MTSGKDRWNSTARLQSRWCYLQVSGVLVDPVLPQYAVGEEHPRIARVQHPAQEVGVLAYGVYTTAYWRKTPVFRGAKHTLGRRILLIKFPGIPGARLASLHSGSNDG
jgi:hypothetical protein